VTRPATGSAVGTPTNHENRQDPPTISQVDDAQDHLPVASGGRLPLADDTAPRVFIGYNEAPGRPATLDEAWRFALEILTLVDGLEA